VIRVCVIRVVCARDETSEERCEKKTEVTICLSVRYFWFSLKQEEKERHKCLHK
jgi:hypothetical protein